MMKKLLFITLLSFFIFHFSFFISQAQPSITADDTTSFCSGDSVHLCVNPGYSSYLWNNGANTQCITVTQSGSYFPWLIDSLGHIDTTLSLNPKIVVVHQALIPLIISNGYNLSVSQPFSSYQWYINGQIYPGAIQQNICPPMSGNYSVHITDSFGCVGISNIIEFDMVPPLNQFTIFCNYRTLTTNSGYNSYQWYLNDTLISGATSQTYQAVQSGNYLVIAFTYNYCSRSTPVFYFNYNSPCYTGINDNNNLTNLSLSPNPASNKILIEAELKQPESLKIGFKDILGRIIKMEENENAASSIFKKEYDVSNFPKGLYFISITTKEGMINKKFIIER